MSAEVIAATQPTTKQTSESEDLSDNLPDEQNAVFEVRQIKFLKITKFSYLLLGKRFMSDTIVCLSVFF